MDNKIDIIIRSEGLCNICGCSYLVPVVPRFARFTCCEDCFRKVTENEKQCMNQTIAIFNELQKDYCKKKKQKRRERLKRFFGIKDATKRK